MSDNFDFGSLFATSGAGSTRKASPTSQEGVSFVELSAGGVDSFSTSGSPTNQNF